MYFRLISAFERLKVELLLIYESEINIIVKIIIYEITNISALSESRGLWNEAFQCAGCSTFSYSWSGRPVNWRKFAGDISRKTLPNKPAAMAKSN